jgi:hypothetical protein
LFGGEEGCFVAESWVVDCGGKCGGGELEDFCSVVVLDIDADSCFLQAVFWFLSMEKCCQSQLMAEAAAGSRGERPVAIGAEEAAYTYRTVGSTKAGWFSAKPLFDVIHKETGGDYLE